MALPGLLIVLVLTIYHPLSLSIVLGWWNNDTLNQGVLIIPACIWLFFTNKNAVSEARPWWPGLVLFLLAGILIQIGEQTHTQALAEIGLLSSVLLIPVSLYGWQFLRSYWFVFVFALFAFPIWSVLTPYAQLLTTHATVTLLSLSSLPIYAEGFSIEIPAGSFIVEEGCSGMRYLVSALAIGSLYVYLSAGKWTTRLWMFWLLVALALIGNWIRILSVITIANFWGIDHPMVDDHATLGWIIFAILLMGWFWLGNRVLTNASNNGPRTSLSSLITGRQLAAFTVPLLIIAGGVPVAADRFLAPPQFRPIAAENLLLPNWQLVNDDEWLQPRFPGGSQFTFQQQNSPTVINLIVYQQQADGEELINETNSTFEPKRWQLLERSALTAILLSGDIKINEQLVRQHSDKRRLIWSWYEFGTRRTTSTLYGKLYGLRSLLEKRNGTAIVIFSTTVTDSIPKSRQQLNAAIKQAWPAMTQALTEVLAP